MSELVPLPKGFRAAGVACGIKSDSTKLDLSLFVSDTPCVAAGVFTQNHVCGAPVKVSRERVPSSTVRGVVINSGNSNACTGEKGLEDARWMTGEAARQLGCRETDVLVCSTGVIGHFLPREKLAAGIPVVAGQLAATPEAFRDAARGMMTTDTFAKQATREARIGEKPVRVSGASKGAAMIAPNMATMLAVIMTDARLSPEEADEMLRHAVDRSFNCISVEGHTSTSDTVLLLANAACGAGSINGAEKQQLQQALDDVAMDLATAIIRDAEGADHLVTIDVRGARDRSEARTIAKAVADSPLVKTAITGNDPNWGRIVSAVGYCGVPVREEEISLSINGTPIYRSGARNFDAAALSKSMKENRNVDVLIDLTHGDQAIRFWTCDLTAEYARLNSDYTT